MGISFACLRRVCCSRYKQELGVDMSKDIETHKQKVLEELCPESEHPAIEPPPYENFGFGTEEDSLGSFFYLVPKVR